MQTNCQSGPTTANSRNSTPTSAISASALSLDHPGWLTDEHGRARRAFQTGDLVWAICQPTNATFDPIIEIAEPGAANAHPVADWFDTATLPTFFHTAKPIRDGVRICRVRTTNLWEALLPRVLRHRRSAEDARQRYRQLCVNHGSVISTAFGPAVLPPPPTTVVALPDEAFIQLGLRDRTERLRCIADGYLNQTRKWIDFAPCELFTKLKTIRHVGAATAGAAVADSTNDYRFHIVPQHTLYNHWQRLVEIPTVEQEFLDELTKLSPDQRSTLIVAMGLASPALHQ